MRRASARLSKISSLRHSSVARQARHASPRGAQASVEGLNVAVLLRFAGVDVMPLDFVVVRPLQDGLAGKLGPVVRDDAGGLATDPDQRIQFPRHPGTGDAGVRDQAEVFSAAIIVYGQNAELAAGSEGVGHRAMRTPLVRVTMARIQGPTLVRALRHWHQCPTAARPFAAATAAH